MEGSVKELNEFATGLTQVLLDSSIKAAACSTEALSIRYYNWTFELMNRDTSMRSLSRNRDGVGTHLSDKLAFFRGLNLLPFELLECSIDVQKNESR